MTDAISTTGLETRFPEVFNQPLGKRFLPLLVVVGLIAYLAYAVWFFALPRVLAEARWDRTGIALMQWISYEVRPEFRLGEGALTPKWALGNPLGDDPHPDWVVANPDGSYTVLLDGAGKSATFGQAVVRISNGDTVTIQLGGTAPLIRGAPPAWLTVKGDEVTANLGFAGEVRVSPDRIKFRKRFLGWPNFIFDTRSPFFGKPLGEVAGLVVSGPDLKPGTSNLAMAWDNIWNNAEWQHGDVWVKLLQTAVMAFAGTLFGALIALPLAFAAARNINPSRLANQLTKRFFDFMRAVDMLIWALFFTRAFGPGPLSGIGAIFFTEIGTLGKLYSEGLENIDDKQREGITSTGANPLEVQRFGVVPQVLPVMISQTLYQWESNTRSATIIGAVGAGGIGLKLWEAMRTNSNWANVFYMVLLILVVVYAIDTISNALRSRLIGMAV